MGPDPFGHWLEDAVKGRMLGERSFSARRISKLGDAKSCRVLFVSSSGKNLSALLSGLTSTGVLTVGESEAAREAGVVVTFAMEGRKVRFGINSDAAEREKLRFSSKLLSLSQAAKK